MERSYIEEEYWRPGDRCPVFDCDALAGSDEADGEEEFNLRQLVADISVGAYAIVVTTLFDKQQNTPRLV